jgi:2-C-methyl-D-erythritol 2,4-cyclodiphosphate synthase
MKIGFGYDVHKLVRGRKLMIGGVEIPHSRGLLGWSDGDVLLHAIIDALLGALAEGDIGKHFPPGDMDYHGIASLKLLEHVKKLLEGRSHSIVNIDCTIVAEEPKFSPYIEIIRATIARTLGISTEQVNVKGKTEEQLGFTGAKKGIKAYAVCLVQKKL